MAKDDNVNFTKLGTRAGLGLVALIGVFMVISGAMTTVGADEVVVKQDVMGGTLQVWDGRVSPGPHPVLWGSVTRYKVSAQLWFSEKEDEGKKTDESIQVDRK